MTKQDNSAKSDYKFSFQQSVTTLFSEMFEADADLKTSPVIRRMNMQFIIVFFVSGWGRGQYFSDHVNLSVEF